MANTFIIKEEVLNEVANIMKPTESQFNSNMRYFLHQLISDPVHAEIPTCIKMANVSRSRFIKMLIDRGIVSRSERLNDTNKDGTHKTPTMSVKYTIIDKIPDEFEYKVSKTDFDRRIEKLRRSIFEKNLPQKKFNSPLGDELAIAKNSPLTMGFIAPGEKKHDAVSWMQNRAAEALNANLVLREQSSYNPKDDNPRKESDKFTDEENEIIRIVNKEIEKTHLPKDEEKEHYNTYAIRWAEFYYDDIVKTFAMNVWGGFNGSGDWFDYFKVLADFCKRLEEQGICVYLIDAQNDCADDVYDMQFGLKKKNDELNEEGGDGGATSADTSGAFVQPLFKKIVRRQIKEILERLTPDAEISSRYRNLGGGFDVKLEDGTFEKSLVTIQNKSTKTLYHICFDGATFNVFRDMGDGMPCTHMSYVFDKLINTMNQDGYVNVNESTMSNGRVFRISEEQYKQIEETTSTMNVGGPKTDYQYTVPFPVDDNDETMQRHNGEGGSISINHIRESKNYVNMDVDVRDGGRHAVKMTEDDFKQEMIHAYHMYAMEQEHKYKGELKLTPSPGNFVYNLCYKNRDNEKSKYAAKLYKDIWGGKYKFDSENVDDRGGIKMSSKGFPYIMCYAGGDWECPVCFFVYFDGTHFRGYVPLKGNAINRSNNTAFQGGGDEEEAKFIAKEMGVDYEEAKSLTSDIDFNEDACLKDFLSRVEVKGSYKKRDYTKDEERFKEYRKEKIAEEDKRREEAEKRRQMNTQENNSESIENTVTSLNEEKKNYLEKHGIKEVSCGLGYSEKEEKWYGWSHRAIHGFGIGDKCVECYPTGTKEGKIIKTMEQAKEAAKKFADSVS